jgi:hypothetical protein
LVSPSADAMAPQFSFIWDSFRLEELSMREILRRLSKLAEWKMFESPWKALKMC